MKKALFALMIALVLAVVCNPISAEGTDGEGCSVEHPELCVEPRGMFVTRLHVWLIYKLTELHRINNNVYYGEVMGASFYGKTRERNKLDELSCRNIINRTATVRIKT